MKIRKIFSREGETRKHLTLKMRREWLLALVLNCLLIECSSWNYLDDGEEMWADLFPQCAGENQSPINILTASTRYQSFPPWNLSVEHRENLFFLLQFNQWTINVQPLADVLWLTGSDLPGRFQLLNIHLHWGPNDRRGSEHQM